MQQMQNMPIADFVEMLKTDGVILYLHEGSVRVKGSAQDIKRWKPEMQLRKADIHEYLTAQASQYVDPIKKFDEGEEETAEELRRRAGEWDSEIAWGYYSHFSDILQARKRNSTKTLPIPPHEISFIGRAINLAAQERDTAKFMTAVDRWFKAHMDMLDQVDAGTWEGPFPWEKRQEALALYSRTTKLIEFAYSHLPVAERPNRKHPDIIMIEGEIEQCFIDRDIEGIVDGCKRLSRKWREIGLVVQFK